MERPSAKDGGVKSVSRALKILDAFSPEHPELSLNDISKITGFYKSTILRQIDTLSKEGYLVKSSETGRYWLGAKLYFLGQIFVQSSSLLRSADSILKEVVEELQETTGIFVTDAIERLCLKMVSGPHFIRATFKAGQKMPIYAGASGKVLLAFSPDAFLNKVIDETGLQRHTELTITDPDELRSELARIRAQGFAVSWGERVPSAVTASVPVFGSDNNLACALSTSGPSERLTENKMPEAIKVLQIAGRKLSTEIGYHGDYWDKVIEQPLDLEGQMGSPPRDPVSKNL